MGASLKQGRYLSLPEVLTSPPLRADLSVYTGRDGLCGLLKNLIGVCTDYLELVFQESALGKGRFGTDLVFRKSFARP